MLALPPSLFGALARRGVWLQPPGVSALLPAELRDGKDQVAPVERRFAGEKNEEDRLLNSGLDLRLPELAGSNRLLVLPQAERFHRAAKLAAQFPLNAVSQCRERATGIFVIFPRIAKEADEFRKFSQG